ncbi:hypothetical protein FRC07_004389 [Ceratobasidium sp. 392]|nr:hypothetical protein FRC07_004389 [Ceratobasidium sp. 392]
MSSESLALLLPAISLSGCLNDLTINLETNENPQEIVNVLEIFLRGTRTKTLVCSGSGGIGSHWALLHSSVILSLQDLVLPYLSQNLSQDTVDNFVVEIRRDTGENTLTNKSSRFLPHLFLEAGTNSLSFLRIIVRQYAVQNLHIKWSRCLGGRPNDEDALNKIKATLLDEISDLVCNISDSGPEWLVVGPYWTL